jgi:hypothetical protein
VQQVSHPRAKQAAALYASRTASRYNSANRVTYCSLWQVLWQEDSEYGSKIVVYAQWQVMTVLFWTPCSAIH